VPRIRFHAIEFPAGAGGMEVVDLLLLGDRIPGHDIVRMVGIRPAAETEAVVRAEDIGESRMGADEKRSPGCDPRRQIGGAEEVVRTELLDIHDITETVAGQDVDILLQFRILQADRWERTPEGKGISAHGAGQTLVAR
jgi:hypothetical protein